MDRWLTVRKVDLDDHVRDLEEKVAVEGEQGLEDCEVNDDGDEDLEMGAEDSLGLTDDEEVYSDNLNDSSDSEWMWGKGCIIFVQAPLDIWTSRKDYVEMLKWNIEGFDENYKHYNYKEELWCRCWLKLIALQSHILYNFYRKKHSPWYCSVRQLIGP